MRAVALIVRTTSKTSGPRFCALTSTLMSTEGCVVCWIRLCGARGFSNDKSLMYWALTISCCAPSGNAGGMSPWPLPLASSAITASPGPEPAGLTRIGKAHQRSARKLGDRRQINSSFPLPGVTTDPRTNALAEVLHAPHVVKHRAEARSPVFLYGGRARKGDGRLSAIFRYHPVRDGRRLFGATPAQRSWAADRKRAAARIVCAARAACAGKGAASDRTQPRRRCSCDSRPGGRCGRGRIEPDPPRRPV